MAKKKKDPLEKKKRSLELKDVLSALDYKNKKFYDLLEDQQKKEYAPFILMRFMSSTPDQSGYHEYHLQSVNDIVNIDFWTLSKHPELQHLLFCIVGLGKKLYHPWIPAPKKVSGSKCREFFQKIYPGINDIELKILYDMYNVEEFVALLKDHGYQDEDVKNVRTEFEKIKQ